MRGYDYYDLSDHPERSLLLWWTGLLLIVVGTLILGILLAIPLFVLVPEGWMMEVGAHPRGGFGFYLNLFMFFIPVFGLTLLMWSKGLGLKVARLMEAGGRLRWGHMGRAMAVVFVSLAAFTALDYLLDPDGYAAFGVQTDWPGYAVLLLITLLLCPIQASSEELLLRGYGAHMLVRTFERMRIGPRAAVWAAYALSSALFASLHLGNSESVGQLWPYMVSIFVFGAGMCVLVHVEGGLESAVGFHIANNIFVFSVVGYSDPDLPDSALI